MNTDKLKQKIRFILDDLQSLKGALDEYKRLLECDCVFERGNFNLDFVHVKEGMDFPIPIESVEKNLIDKLDNISEMDYSRENEIAGPLSEGLFFAHCFKFEELEEDIILTLKEIVNYSRRHNDTAYMWLDGYYVFGLDPLYMLSLKYPQHSYLMGAYLIPYWDSEHAPYVMRYFESLYRRLGFDENLLKTFCYCDNSEARIALLGRDSYSCFEEGFNLYDHLKDSPSAYAEFKECLKERFMNQDFIQYCEQSYTDRPIETFYDCIYYTKLEEEDFCDYTELGLDSIFISDTYRNEAYSLQLKIEKYTGKPIAGPDIDLETLYRQNKADALDDFSVWPSFFEDGFKNGVGIWNYIAFGKDESVLDGIEKAEAFYISKSKNLPIAKLFKWFIGRDESFEERFFAIFNQFVDSLDNFDEIPKFSVNGKQTWKYDISIRFLDVFYRLMGKKILMHDVFEYLVSNEMIDIRSFMERFDSNCENFISDLSYLIGESNQRNHLKKLISERIYSFLCKDRALALSLMSGDILNHMDFEELESKISYDYFIRDFQSDIYRNGLAPSPRMLSLVASFLYSDSINDDLTDFMVGFLEKNMIPFALETMNSQSSMEESDLNQVCDFIKGHKDDIETVVEILKSKLDTEEDPDDPQIHYECLSSYDEDSLDNLITGLYLSSFKFRIPSSPSFMNLLKLLFEIAPIKVINSSSKYLDCHMDILENVDLWYDFKREMGRLTRKKSFYRAWELLCDDENKCEHYIDAYIEDDQRNSLFKNPSKREIEDSISLLPYQEQVWFYKKVMEQDESIQIDISNLESKL